MTIFFLKIRSKKFAFARGSDPYNTEHVGPFFLKSNAEQARYLLRRINANTGCYHDTVEVMSKVPSGSLCFLWQEYLPHLRCDPRPYELLAGDKPINVAQEELRLRVQDMKALGMEG